MINSKNIGRQIRDLRLARGWRQNELAEKVGLARSTMSNIESGKRSLTLKTLKTFCEVFNVDISYFGIETANFDETLDLTSRIAAIFNADDLPDEKKDAPKRSNADLHRELLNSGWRSIYDGMSRENKRTFWRGIIKEIRTSTDNKEVFVEFL